MVFKSTFDDVKPPAEFKDSLSLYFSHQMDKFADRVLMVDFESGREWTGSQIKTETLRIARYLIEKLGLKPGDNCVLFGYNNDQIQLLAMAILFVGGSIFNWDPRDTTRDLKYILDCMKPALVFAHSSVHQLLVDYSKEKSANYKICIMDDDMHQEKEFNDVIGFQRQIWSYKVEDDAKTLELPVLMGPDDAAYVLFTSGSTGKPKPVARSHRNSLYVCFAFQKVPEQWHMDENSVLSGHLPLDHGTGIFCIKMTMSKGLKLIIMKGYTHADLMTAIERYKITDCMLGSAFLHNLMLAPETERHNLSSMRNFISIGSPLASHATAISFMERHPNLSIRQAFGMTECGFVAVLPRDEAGKVTRSVGKLLPNVVVKLVDPETNKEINTFDTPGELYVSSPTISPGYIGAMDQWRAVYGPDNFYRTFDLASISSDIKLSMRGRVNEMLCLGDGWKVLPAEIEEILHEHPMIREAAIIGVPNPELPTCHLLRAFVVSTEWGKLTEKEIFDWAAERMNEYKHLTGGIKLMEKLPRISVGKVDKKALRAVQM